MNTPPYYYHCSIDYSQYNIINNALYSTGTTATTAAAVETA